MLQHQNLLFPENCKTDLLEVFKGEGQPHGQHQEPEGICEHAAVEPCNASRVWDTDWCSNQNLWRSVQDINDGYKNDDLTTSVKFQLKIVISTVQKVEPWVSSATKIPYNEGSTRTHPNREKSRQQLWDLSELRWSRFSGFNCCSLSSAYVFPVVAKTDLVVWSEQMTDLKPIIKNNQSFLNTISALK